MEDLGSPSHNNIEDQAAPKLNFAEIEKCFRELKSELYIKRNENVQMKSELEKINQENHKLKASLDKITKESEERQITMDLFMKKSQDFEPRYYEKRDALFKMEMQYKLAISKYEVVRDELRKATMDKADLIRKVDVLEEKQKNDSNYNVDISQKIIHLKEAIATITDDLTKFKEEHNELASISKKTDMVEEALEKYEQLKKLNEKLRDEKLVLEAECVKYKAKFEQANKFLEKCPLAQETDLLAQVLLTQCKKTSDFYTAAVEQKDEIITKLNENLCEEKSLNVQLLEEIDNLSSKVAFLENKHKEMELSHSKEDPIATAAVRSPSVTEIKIENFDSIIEILDDDDY